MLHRTRILRGSCEQQDDQRQDAPNDEEPSWRKVALPRSLPDGQFGTLGLTSVEHDVGSLSCDLPSLSSDVRVHSKVALHHGGALLPSLLPSSSLKNSLHDLHHALVGLLQSSLYSSTLDPSLPASSSKLLLAL